MLFWNREDNTTDEERVACVSFVVSWSLGLPKPSTLPRTLHVPIPNKYAQLISQSATSAPEYQPLAFPTLSLFTVVQHCCFHIMLRALFDCCKLKKASFQVSKHTTESHRMNVLLCTFIVIKPNDSGVE